VPFDDNAATPNVEFLSLWPNIKDGLPKKDRKDGTVTLTRFPACSKARSNAL